MPLSDKERSRNYRERKKAQTGAKVRIHHTREGVALRVYTLTDIATLVQATEPQLTVSSIRATIKAWFYKEAVPCTGLAIGIGSVRIFTEEQKDLIIKVYKRHIKKQMSILEVGNWLAARWSKACN